MPARPVDETTPAFRNIDIRNVRCNGARRAMYFNGLPEMNVERVVVADAQFRTTTGAQLNESTDVVLRNVTVVPAEGPALSLNNVKRFRAENFVCPEGMPCALTVTGSRNKEVSVQSPQITAANACLSPKSASVVTIE